LVFRRNDFASFGSENPSGSTIHLRKEFALHAAEEKSNALALCPFCRRDFQDLLSLRELRHQRFHGLESLWKQLQEASAANQRLQTRFLVDEQGPAKETESIRPREDGEEKTAMKSFGKGAWMMAFDLRASRFD
jgi:hypothetical protein